MVVQILSHLIESLRVDPSSQAKQFSEIKQLAQFVGHFMQVFMEGNILKSKKCMQNSNIGYNY